MGKRYEQAFLDGYKPVTIGWKGKLFNEIYYEQLIKYPHINPYEGNPNGYIFFQNNQLKETYLERMKAAKNEYEKHIVLGEMLGFPEKSVKKYAEMRVLEDELGEYPEIEGKQAVGVEWAGFYFTTYLDFIESEIQWLWETYQHPKAVNNPLCLWSKDVDAIEILYGDCGAINEAVRFIKEKRNLVPINI
ncbi:hypothetical protein [Laceyella tengchongensis]|uniref:hypothetical protein n=1 Tax=Laceyella tengchongensis TaxID=574699 RepID=UPI0012B93716|nr:hypothetical protein [Laceyella tengchongensis]